MYTRVQTVLNKPGLGVKNAILHALLSLAESQMTLLLLLFSSGEATLE